MSKLRLTLAALGLALFGAFSALFIVPQIEKALAQDCTVDLCGFSGGQMTGLRATFVDALNTETIAGAKTFSSDMALDDGTTDSPSLTFQDATNETAVLTKVDSDTLTVTTAAADGLEVVTGNLIVGNGTPGTNTPDGEDLYVEGTVEIDGAVQLDGAVTFNGGMVAETETTTATDVLTAADSGKTIFLNSATEFVTTLPAVGTAGLNYRIIVAAAPSGASYTVVTAASANVLNIVAWAGGIDDAADVATARDVVTFVDGQAVVGDWIYCISDATSWQCTGGAAVAAGLTTGQT